MFSIFGVGILALWVKESFQYTGFLSLSQQTISVPEMTYYNSIICRLEHLTLLSDSVFFCAVFSVFFLVF